MTRLIYTGGMGRVSQAQAQENRRRVVATAARLFRERGVAGVSVADVMGAAGLTHGGFYKQFASKEALVAEAVGQAFADRAAWLRELGEAEGDGEAARRTFVEAYLSPAHRDDPGDGCPAAGLSADVARDPGSAAREAYADGIRAYARWLGDGTQGDPADADLTAVSTLVGAVVLARATAGTDLSDRILAAARAALTPPA
jgi:TetR/AcrR family transcriptional regulator, transcriptional repressor for nem operon